MQYDKEVTDFLNAAGQLDLPKFSFSEIKEDISKLNVKKALGHNLITGKILKELPPCGIKFIMQSYNAIVRLSYFHQQWKAAVIKVIPKPDKPLEKCSSYRPISFLSLLFKIFEKLILQRLKPHLASMSIIPDHQFGFRYNHSTVKQVHRVYNKSEIFFKTRNIVQRLF